MTELIARKAFEKLSILAGRDAISLSISWIVPFDTRRLLYSVVN